MDADTTFDDLKKLHTNAIDARHGYEEALRDAEGHGLTPLFRDMIALHTTNAEDLAAMLSRAGQFPDHDGSFMSTVHRTIISIRALFGGLNTSILPGLIDGEHRNVTAYGKFLDHHDLSPETRDALQKQRHRIEDAIIRMESLKPV